MKRIPVFFIRKLKRILKETVEAIICVIKFIKSWNLIKPHIINYNYLLNTNKKNE